MDGLQASGYLLVTVVITGCFVCGQLVTEVVGEAAAWLLQLERRLRRRRNASKIRRRLITPRRR